MIVGLGIDGVEIERFAAWPQYDHARLRQVFGPIEIAYALSVPLKAPERLAARFAAKEAAYKALAHLMPKQITFMAFAKLVQLINDPNGAPSLKINLEQLGLNPSLKLLVSLSHTSHTAMAAVIAQL
jgi:holo-[acyl-carrier protein] synthase